MATSRSHASCDRRASLAAAAWSAQGHKVYPFHLFVASAQEMLTRYEGQPELHAHPLQQALYHALKHEKSWLQETGQWPDPVPTLADLK